MLDDTVESEFILIENSTINCNKPTLMGIIYRPANLPVIPFLEHLDQLLSVIKDMNVKHHLCGVITLIC